MHEALPAVPSQQAPARRPTVCSLHSPQLEQVAAGREQVGGGAGWARGQGLPHVFQPFNKQGSLL